ncbi:flavin reductase family protein [Afipia sp. DC4300-2b1]|uniref:flavin reductase family protein n=1 Tax=Afipia sp. DC4300-2b1 TaxID=2804672 RepID=UPI003CF10522
MVSLVRNVSSNEDVATVVFKSAMRQLAGGVTVITAGRDSDVSGMTVTSFTSFAADPPCVVVSLNKESSSLSLIKRYGAFGANVLASDQASVAESFTGRSGLKGIERFQGANLSRLASETPLLSDSLAVFDCEVDHILERHSHVLLIGQVLDLRISPNKSAGLVYWNGRYVPVDDKEEALHWADVSLPKSRALWEV